MSQPTTATAPDTVVSTLIDAWNRHDMEAHTALFHPDADFVNVIGMRMRGRPEIDKMHAHLHRTRQPKQSWRL